MDECHEPLAIAVSLAAVTLAAALLALPCAAQERAALAASTLDGSRLESAIERSSTSSRAEARGVVPTSGSGA